MKENRMTLPDGSEIRTEEGNGITWTAWEEGAYWDTSDPALIEAIERQSQPGESTEETFRRILNKRFEEICNRPGWEQNPEAWKRNDHGED
jgi:hypothetical protein